MCVRVCVCVVYMTALGVLCCVTLLCRLYDLACFFLPSASHINMYIYTVCSCVSGTQYTVPVYVCACICMYRCNNRLYMWLVVVRLVYTVVHVLLLDALFDVRYVR